MGALTSLVFLYFKLILVEAKMRLIAILKVPYYFVPLKLYITRGAIMFSLYSTLRSQYKGDVIINDDRNFCKILEKFL